MKPMQNQGSTVSHIRYNSVCAGPPAQTVTAISFVLTGAIQICRPTRAVCHPQSSGQLQDPGIPDPPAEPHDKRPNNNTVERVTCF